MAFFKFRLPGQQAAEAQGNYGNAPTESVEALRRRARHRLIGASVLVLVGVIGFPLVFDTQPRPVSSDLVVEIPDRNDRAPARSKTAQPTLDAAAALDPKEEVVSAKPVASESAPGKSAAGAAPEAAAKVAQVKPADAKPADAKADEKPAEAKPAADKSNDKAADHKTAAKPEDKEVRKDAATGRFVVQAGAFSDEAKVREVRSKVEKAGLKTYTQVADTKEGKRTRVRVGPFASRDEADKAAAKLRHLGLQPQILSL